MSRTNLAFVSSELHIRDTMIRYKPIPSIDHNDLDFLIPADYDTYIDTDIKRKGRLTKAYGRAPFDHLLREMLNVRLHVPYRGKGE